MMIEKPDLVSLLGSRICHDLISPIGAIGNGVELMMMEGGMRGAEITMIADSVVQANARIRLFRVAFGSARADQRISLGEITSIFDDLWRGGRLSLEWISSRELPRHDVKLLFLLLQCLESAMPYGGRIRVERGDTRWGLQATTQNRFRVEPALWELLSNPAVQVEIGAAQVHFALASAEFQRQHRRLTAELGENAIRLSF